MRQFNDLSEREILALAIANEEEDGRIYADYAEHLRENYPDSAAMFDDMAAEEEEHRRSLIDLYVEKFGRHIPYVTRREVRGAPAPASPRTTILRGIDAIRAEAQRMETNASRFYREAADRSTDQGIAALVAAADHQAAECAEAGTDRRASGGIRYLLLARVRVGGGACGKIGRAERDDGQSLDHQNRYPRRLW